MISAPVFTSGAGDSHLIVKESGLFSVTFTFVAFATFSQNSPVQPLPQTQVSPMQIAEIKALVNSRTWFRGWNFGGPFLEREFFRDFLNAHVELLSREFKE